LMERFIEGPALRQPHGLCACSTDGHFVRRATERGLQAIDSAYR